MIKKTFLPVLFGFIITQFVYSQKDSSKITVKEYINIYKSAALYNMENYSIPASITIAQGILESANGNSVLARKANNHFGIKCHKDWKGKTFFKDDDEKNECFRVYENANLSFKDHSAFLTSKQRYASLFAYDIMDYKSWAQGLKDAGYATNVKYPQLLIKIIEDNKLNEIDKEAKNIRITANNQDVIFKLTVDDMDDFEAISIGNNNRKVFLNNEIRFIFAKKGDSFAKISEDFELTIGQLLRYNDFTKDYIIKDGETIYIESKRRKGFADFHIVKKNETYLGISQFYGIKLRQLYKKNHLEKDSKPVVGQKLWLKKKKPK